MFIEAGGLLTDANLARVGAMTDEELLTAGLRAINAWRERAGAKPLTRLPTHCTRGSWDTCLLGQTIPNGDASSAKYNDAVLCELEARFENRHFPQLERDPEVHL